MHKKLAADLTSLAHSILQMKNKEDVFALQEKAHKVYEKLSVLAYIEEYINNTPNPTKTKEELIAQVENNTVTKPVDPITEQPFEELEKILFEDKSVGFKNDPKDIGEAKNKPTLEDELKDTIPVDIAMELFEKTSTKKSLNDQLSNNIQIGLNDRIAFVKNLFNDSQEDFNRVISQLNTIKTEKEAKSFILKTVKPDYNWAEQEELENRLLNIIERKFS